MNIRKYLPHLNVLWIFVLLGVLAGSLYVQFFLGELPCRLCTWQRMTMLFIVTGLLLNLKFGQNTRHYGLIIIFALFGCSVSIRQILSYIMPGDPGFGPAVLGLHMYTWAFLVFICSLIASAFMLIIGLDQNNENDLPPRLVKVVFAMAMITALLFSVSTFKQCGLAVCPAATTIENMSITPSDLKSLCCPEKQ